jgi:sentrin-specific protease 1
MQIDIFDHDLLVIPCHVNGDHWTCVAVDFRLKQVQYYDSCGRRGDPVFDAIRQYLSNEHLHKKLVVFDFEGWANVLINGPRQENGSDCGVFVCQMVENLSRGVLPPFEFSQKDAEFLRKSMILHIGDGRLPYLPL